MKKNFLAGTILSLSLVLSTIAAPVTAFAGTTYTFSEPKTDVETQVDEVKDGQKVETAEKNLKDGESTETKDDKTENVVKSEEHENPYKEHIAIADEEWAKIAEYLSKKAEEKGETFDADASLTDENKEKSYKLDVTEVTDGETTDTTEKKFSVFIYLGEDENPVELVETVKDEPEISEKEETKEEIPEQTNTEEEQKEEESETTGEETPAEEETQELETEETPLATQSSEEVEMYRLYNPNSGEHFYTGNADEREHLIMVGWTWEGVGWYAPAKSSVPVYRLYNPNAGDHHYTMNKDERDYLKSLGWNDEGIGWYSDENKTCELYRQYNPNAVSGAHNYTTNKYENDMLVSAGWNAEGTAWYATKPGYSLKSPVTRADREVQGVSSPTAYMIILDTPTYTVSVYNGSQGNWTKVLGSRVSIGRSTPRGTFHMGETNQRMRYFNSGTDCYCWWATNITGRAGENYFFHSVLYKYGEEEPRTIIDGRLGETISHGCVRMPIENAKWIYDNVPDGTTIWIR